MLEMRVDFRSQQEWDDWSSQNDEHFASWRQQVVDHVKSHGLLEPISGVRQPPSKIVFKEANLRESISAGEMNSRKRAALLVLDLARLQLRPERRLSPRIFGTEALTRVGRVLRGAFAYYLGTEYLATDAEREKHFPIVHADLTDVGFKDEVFDMFHSGDVLEHVPDVRTSLSEVARVLAPGGIAVSTFPFSPAEANTRVKARLVCGKIEHLETPEYHGNPAHPAGGSLVFSRPGWDILDLCKDVGFADAKMTLVISSSYGVASSQAAGVFVLSAFKGSSTVDGGAKRSSKRMALHYEGPERDKIIGVIALPRSGASTLSARLGTHPKMNSVDDPWISSPDRRNQLVGLSGFLKALAKESVEKPIVCIKAIATNNDYIYRIVDVLRSAEPPFQRDLICMLRNPLNVFLSEFAVDKSRPGESDLALSTAVFDRWAERTLEGLRRLLVACNEFNAVLVSYEGFATRERDTMQSLMQKLEIEPSKAEWPAELCGVADRDLKSAETDAMSSERRERELLQLDGLLREFKHAAILQSAVAAFRGMETQLVIRSNAAPARTMISTLLTQLTANKSLQ